jgi:hypothetical protein
MRNGNHVITIQPYVNFGNCCCVIPFAPAALLHSVTAGMSVARLNMSHGSHESHKAVIDLVQAYNETGRGCVATMLDTKVRHFQALSNKCLAKAAETEERAKQLAVKLAYNCPRAAHISSPVPELNIAAALSHVVIATFERR